MKKILIKLQVVFCAFLLVIGIVITSRCSDDKTSKRTDTYANKFENKEEEKQPSDKDDSVSNIENKLAKTWYETPDYNNGVLYGSIVEFYLNGKIKSQYYVKDPPYLDYEGWFCHCVETRKWEIMEDKTLHFDGEYYEWGDEWYLRGDTLKIGDSIYSATDAHEYE